MTGQLQMSSPVEAYVALSETGQAYGIILTGGQFVAVYLGGSGTLIGSYGDPAAAFNGAVAHFATL